ncbi:uncharacterized protein LOC119101150 [Pollicipes pollicipes]|uniref:uncharacterized protein LOC119101150 n=1 Tax=Pollicipes pollicipes TaxID=41117 RepID=UPI001884EAC4|nr:uncharacterized protein LOC119101150 [Pollicipes pollicipes]
MRPAGALMLVFLAAACLLALVQAFPQGGYKPAPSYSNGRVKIQAYRGPNKEKVGYEYFAPWGYYVTQPEDDKGYGH